MSLGASRTLGSDSENRPRRDQFSTISPGNSRTIAQEIGEKWAGEVDLQPEIPKSERLLGTVLAFDFGTTKIGVAVGDWETRMAHPLEVIRGEANDVRFARIAALINEWRPTQLVSGLPLSLDGEEHDLTRRARRFANQLNGRFHLPVTLVDERLTSVEADARLREAGVKAGARRAVEDSVAAQQILQDHFDHAGQPTSHA